jgi:uncharacterized coiled-coil DUF342 family protein
MSDVTRYTYHEGSEDIFESDNGEWVTYDDYENLKEEYDNLKADYEDLEKNNDNLKDIFEGLVREINYFEGEIKKL